MNNDKYKVVGTIDIMTTVPSEIAHQSQSTATFFSNGCKVQLNITGTPQNTAALMRKCVEAGIVPANMAWMIEELTHE